MLAEPPSHKAVCLLTLQAEALIKMFVSGRRFKECNWTIMWQTAQGEDTDKNYQQSTEEREIITMWAPSCVLVHV